MEEILRASSSSSSSWPSLCSRIPSNSPLMTAELMDWSTFISISLTFSSSSVVSSVLRSSTATFRGLDVKAGGETINPRPEQKVLLADSSFKKQRWFQQTLEAHLTEDTSGGSWCSQLKVGWAHLVALKMLFAERPTPKITFVTVMEVGKNTSRCFPSC